MSLSCCCCLVTKLCLTLCDSMDCSTPGFPVLYYLLEFDQLHVLWTGDAIHTSHPVSPSSSAFNLSQHQGLFQWVSSLHQVAKVLKLGEIRHSSRDQLRANSWEPAVWKGFCPLKSRKRPLHLLCDLDLPRGLSEPSLPQWTDERCAHLNACTCMVFTKSYTEMCFICSEWVGRTVLVFGFFFYHFIFYPSINFEIFMTNMY